MAQRSGLSARQVDRTYHPRGGVRARKPFLVPNIIVGSCVALFAGGVYIYSISAVKQDDFSDVEDLLPPLDQRQSMKSIEDELTESQGSSAGAGPSSSSPSLPNFTSSPSAISRSIPGSTSTTSGSGLSTGTAGSGLDQGKRWFGYIPRRLDDLEWVKRRGWVESGKGNVLVWGAPNVDNIGSVEGTTRGPKLV